MTDLYALLGVSRRAKPATIHAAYRKLSKSHHPDAPCGSPERFAELKRARDVLMDQKSRGTYDRTGKIEDAQPDPGRGPLLAMIAGAMDQAIQAVIQSNADVVHCDMVEAIINVLAKRVSVFDKRITAVERGRAVYADKLSGRFSLKGDGEEALGSIVEAKLRFFADEITACQAQIAATKEAIAIVRQHQFRMDLIRASVSDAAQLFHQTMVFHVGPMA